MNFIKKIVHKALNMPTDDELIKLAVRKLSLNSRQDIASQIIEKSTFTVRSDIRDWTKAKDLAKSVEFPSRWRLYNLLDKIAEDEKIIAESQKRKLPSLSANFLFKNSNGEINLELTADLQNVQWLNDIIENILDSRFYGHRLIQFNEIDNKRVVELIPSQNVIPNKGIVYPDYTDSTKVIKYKDLREYGTYIIEFGKPNNFGLYNSAVPIILFKQFARSCWSELCEIYGIPPRVMKTDTQDPTALAKAKKMMKEFGAAAWFIIDSTEEFEFAKGADTNGDVYNNLIANCDNAAALLINGAITGADTKNGSYGKEKVGADISQELIIADQSYVEQQMKSVVIPALISIGWLPEGVSFEYEKNTDLESLWTKVRESMQYYEFDEKWINENFGLKITGKRQTGLSLGANFNSNDSFFV